MFERGGTRIGSSRITRRLGVMSLALLSAASSIGVVLPAAAASGTTLFAWGFNDHGQSTVPAELDGKAVTQITTGESNSYALLSDGSVVGWGYSAANNAAALEAKWDGRKVVAVESGVWQLLELLSDGTVIATGGNGSLDPTPPASLDGKRVTAISAGGRHSLALTSEGTVVAWGENDYGQSTIPAALDGQTVTAISAGHRHNLALLSDGTVVAWGQDTYGQSTVPAGLSDVVAVAAGWGHSLALLSDGSLVEWGQLSPPGGGGPITPPATLTGKKVSAISAGWDHDMALLSDGTVVTWGRNLEGQTTLPDSLTDGGVTAISAGGNHSLAVLGGDAKSVTASFQVLEPVVCLKLNNTSLDFGLLPLGESKELTAATTVTSCGDAATLYAQASDAVTRGTSGAAWQPVVLPSSPLCSATTPPVDQFAYAVTSGTKSTYLTGAAASLGGLAAGATRTDSHTLSAACAGSQGKGDVFALNITYTAAAG